MLLSGFSASRWLLPRYWTFWRFPAIPLSCRNSANQLRCGNWPAHSGMDISSIKRRWIFSLLFCRVRTPAMFSPGELVRIAWRQQIQGLIADVPREDEGLGSAGYGIHVEDRVKHPSVLIRQLGVDLVGSFYRGVDVFAAMYFVRLPGNENAARSLRSSGLIESLAHRSSRGRQAPREEGDEEATD